MSDPYSGSELGRALLSFRESHTSKTLMVDDTGWSYLTGGDGPHTVLYLPGGTGQAEAAFEAISVLEDGCRVIVPSYPQAETMDGLVDGIEALLAAEGQPQVVLWGDSFGSMVAQRFVQTRPDLAAGLVVSHPTVPSEERLTRARSQVRTFTKMPKFAARRFLKLAFRRLLGGADAAEQSFWDAYLTETLAPRAKEAVRNLARLSLDFHTGVFDPQRWEGPTLIVDVGGAPQEVSMVAETREQYPDATIVSVEIEPGTGASKAAALCAAEVVAFAR